MKETTNNMDTEKSKSLKILEYILLVFYLGVIILRVIYTESPTIQSSTISIAASDILYSLYISSAMFFSFLLWLTWSLCSRKFSYRFTGIEVGLFVFCIAAVISAFFAADKRLAINNIILLITPVLCSIILVQVLDTSIKIRLLLTVIAALGVVSAFQCVDQLLFINRETINEYENNPQSMLGPLNIQSDTLSHFMFEERLYSGGGRAFFTTRNSAGSFFLFAFFIIFALVLNSERPFKLKIFFLILLIAIFLTKSKGAIIGLFFAFALFGLYLKYGERLKACRKAILAVSLLLVPAGVLIIAWYGLAHGRLPGGNSMLVRWQYWHASAKMILEHLWTGVGPGNFTTYYPFYKPAAALESVTDPHSFPLSILAQYGIPGLVGFLTMIFIPLWRVTSNKSTVLEPDKLTDKPVIKTTTINIIIFVWFGLIFARMTLLPAVRSGQLIVVIYMLIRYYFPPVFIFIGSLYFLKKHSIHKENDTENTQNKNFIIGVLFCALLGVLLHNLTDYAIFEPGIYTTFWFVIATLIAIYSNSHKTLRLDFAPASYLKAASIFVVLIICFVFLIHVIAPVVVSTDKIYRSNEAFSYGQLNAAHDFLYSAALDDKLNPFALYLNANLYLEHTEISPNESYELLLLAQECLKGAIERNKASFKNFEYLSEVYTKLSEVSPQEEQRDWLNNAFDAAADAKNRYPGCGRLHFNLAQIAEQLEKTEIAVEHYEKAVDIENQYRLQFRQMYPEKEKIVSRLGEEKYQLSIERKAALTEDIQN